MRFNAFKDPKTTPCGAKRKVTFRCHKNSGRHFSSLTLQGPRNDFDIGKAGLTSPEGASVKGESKRGGAPSRCREGEVGGLPRENFEIYDTCRCILSYCWNILFSFFYRDFVSFIDVYSENCLNYKYLIVMQPRSLGKPLRF